MPSRPGVQLIVGAAAAIWLVGLVLQGVDVEWSWMRWYSVAVAGVILGSVVVERWLWRWWPLKIFIKRPDLNGTWCGEIRSSWINPATGNTPPPIQAFLVVRQSLSSLNVELLTQESRSQSLAALLDVSKTSTPSISYTYRNEPRLRFQDRSRIHHGTVFLRVHGSPADLLDGCYWTDRDSKGEMEFDRCVTELHSDFNKAVKAFGSA